MAFSVTGLGEYVNANNTKILSAAILEPITFQRSTIMTGVKHKEELKYLSTNTLVQAYACSTPTSSGTTTLTEKDIQVRSLMIYEELCPEDLTQKSTQLGQKPGMNEDFYFEQAYVNDKIKNTQKTLEGYCWDLVSGGTSRPGSILSIMGSDADVNDNTFVWSATTWTADDYVDQVFAMINALPDDIQDVEDLTLYVPFVIGRRMQGAFIKDGNYHIDLTKQDQNAPWIFPGTNITVVQTQMQANNVVLTPASNIVVAYDLESEFDTAKLWWSDDDQTSKFLMKFRIGFNYFFGDYIVWSR